jgi:phenylpropionate dioxygenase-like ring-hydroxylating dioxygenase large terminal subunit
MKSAYGRKIPAPDHELTSVEAGSPMGELLRRYWQPACTSDELGDLPKKIKILCEEVLLFRDKKGRVGALEPHCSHRGTSLEFGRIEEGGIRCCYHGWLYDTRGHVVEMPCEKEGFCQQRNFWHPSYPTMEYGGLVFIYMGPPDIQPPLLPMFDIIDTRHRDDVVLVGKKLWDDHAIGYVRDCNWLQHYENAADPYHLVVLHEMISGDQFKSVLTEGAWPLIWFEKTAIGMRYNFVRRLPNGFFLERHSECIVPNVVLVANVHQRGAAPIWREKATEVTWVVPVDNETVRGLSIIAWPKLESGGPDPAWKPGTDTITDIRPGQLRDRPFADKQRSPDDMEAQEGQRAVAVHALEHLVGSDTGVILIRKILREAVQAVRKGDEPQNIIRDPIQNHALATSCWNTVMTHEQFEEMKPSIPAKAMRTD